MRSFLLSLIFLSIPKNRAPLYRNLPYLSLLGDYCVLKSAKDVPVLVKYVLHPLAPYYLREMALEFIAKTLGHLVNDDGEPADVVNGQTRMECLGDKQRHSFRGKGVPLRWNEDKLTRPQNLDQCADCGGLLLGQ